MIIISHGVRHRSYESSASDVSAYFLLHVDDDDDDAAVIKIDK